MMYWVIVLNNYLWCRWCVAGPVSLVCESVHGLVMHDSSTVLIPILISGLLWKPDSDSRLTLPIPSPGLLQMSDSDSSQKWSHSGIDSDSGIGIVHHWHCPFRTKRSLRDHTSVCLPGLACGTWVQFAMQNECQIRGHWGVEGSVSKLGHFLYSTCSMICLGTCGWASTSTDCVTKLLPCPFKTLFSCRIWPINLSLKLQKALAFPVKLNVLPIDILSNCLNRQKGTQNCNVIVMARKTAHWHGLSFPIHDFCTTNPMPNAIKT